MLISVIIPTCNRNDLLIKCLDLLAPTTQINGHSYEVVVTDDSKDGMAKGLIEENYHWVKWVQGPRKGPATNRNYGAKQTTGEWLVFIDDDCLPANNLFSCYENAIATHSGTLAFEGTIIPNDWEMLKEDMTECPINTEGGCFWSANVCINRAVFEEIGGFDETFLIAAQEDQDIYKRLLEKTKVDFIKEAVVVHPVRKIPLLKKLRQIPIATRNWFIYEKKHNAQTLSRIQTMFFKFLIDFTKGTIKDLLKGKIKNAILNLSYLFIGIPIYLQLSLKNYRNA